MNLVLIENNKISSLEILKQINIFRLQEGKKTELAHNDLLKIIRDEFEEEISLGKISQSKYKNSRKKEYSLFELTTSQAKQVLVRESKFVRKAIIKVLDEYEKKEQKKNLKDNLLYSEFEKKYHINIKNENEINLISDKKCHKGKISQMFFDFEIENSTKRKLSFFELTILEEKQNLVKELHLFLESKQDFTTWIKNIIEKYYFEKNNDFTLHNFMEGKVLKPDCDLKIKSKLANFIKSHIEKYNFIENENYTKASKILDTPFKGNSTKSTPHARIEYILTIDMAKQLCMLLKVQKGKEAKKYFIECKKQLIKNNEKINSYIIHNLFELTYVLFETDYKEILKKFEQGEL